MINKSKFIMIAAVMTIAVASPAFAQSFSPGDGTGNVLPFAYGPGGTKLNPWALMEMDARRNHLYDYAPNSVRNPLGYKEKLRIR
jgi:hypothetical protein